MSFLPPRQASRPHPRFPKRGLALAMAGLASAAVQAQDTAELDDVVVTATGYQQQTKNAPASISVIDRQTLDDKAYRDVTDALKDVPGVVVTGGGSSKDISLRGMGAKYTLMLVDGKRQGSRETRPGSDGPGIEQGWLPPLSAIERVEVIRGPMSSLYGSDALGGVVNIITRSVEREWGGSVTVDTTIQEDADSGNRQQSRFYVGGPLKEDVLGLKVYGQYSQRDEDQIVNGYNDQRLANATAELSWNASEDHDLSLEAGYSEQERTTNPGESIAEEGRRGPNTRSKDEYDRRHYTLSHKGSWDIGTSDSYVQHEKVRNPNARGGINYEDTVFNTQTVLPLGMHMLTLGGQYETQKLTSQGNTLADDKGKIDRWQWALFVEDEWMLTEDFSLTGGARLNKDENYGTHWSPRLYGVWNTTPQWTVKGGITSGYRAPDLRYTAPGWGQATGGPGGNALLIGNPDLEPEKSLNKELGVLWGNDSGTQVGLTVFHNEFKDKIAEDPVCYSGAYRGDDVAPECVVAGDDHEYAYIDTRKNIDKAVTQGVEATLTLPLAEAYSLTASYTYTDSEQKSGDDKGDSLNNLPEHMANATLDWEPQGPLSAWTRVNFRGRSSGAPQFHGSSGREIPSYTFVDVGTAYQLTPSAKLFGGVYNALDKDVNYADFEKVLDGRRYNLGVTVEF
ncbi:TonB-dependent receptor domain-containing protein [Halomonas garicola]|uniref:TonB-dependent receptor domain-containing protein n=1 Tax=Halomonas garicola TaxID=1690008 RepID=UPI0028984E42|nr:TonB-dependent receptor [Halomonas garicola]